MYVKISAAIDITVRQNCGKCFTEEINAFQNWIFAWIAHFSTRIIVAWLINYVYYEI